ncbi:MAG: sipM [Bacillales bacterium]|jgi:signal peptidase I|nr:sipM [Bacillales bacterium]
MSTEKSQIFEWIKAFVFAILLAFIIRTYLFAPILVDGVSMMPTLHDRNRMIVNKLSYSIGEPKRFDIIVFNATVDKDYIKRIIGLPGDHVEYINDKLYINGKAYDEPYLDNLKKDIIDPPLTQDFKLEDIIGKKTIPKGYLFVMGDNRRYSKDSRSIGVISMKSVVGKANIVYWPINEVRIEKYRQ